MVIRESLLARFSAHAASVEKTAPIDAKSRPLFAILGCALLIELAYLAISDFTISPSIALSAFSSLIFMLAGALLARRYGNPNIAVFLEALTLPVIMGALTVTGLSFLAAHSAPFADQWLIAADRTLGFDWMKLYRFYETHPILFPVSAHLYRSMLLQLPFVALSVFFLCSRQRGWIFLTAWGVASIITALIFPFFTAQGPYVIYGIDPQSMPGRNLPWSTGAMIESLRNGTLRDLNKSMVGMVWFPSFHAAAGALFMWATWPLKRARLVFVPLNLGMMFATIIWGYHYLIDIVGGIAVAVASLLIARSLVQRA